MKSLLIRILRLLSRSGLFRHYATVVYHVAKEQEPKPEDAMDVSYLKHEFLQLIAQSDLRDPALHAYNKKRREERSARARGPMTIEWVIPDVTAPGSGGHMNIFRFARFLAGKGHTIRIRTHLKSRFANDTEMQAYLTRHYVDVPGAQYILQNEPSTPCDIVVASGWETAYRVWARTDALFKAYIVQDFEPWFYPQGSHALMAENTYRMNFFGLCGSPWLCELMEDTYGMDCVDFEFGFDPAHYREDTSIRRDPDLLCVYIRPGSPRRGFELIMGALQEIKRRRPATKIALFGYSGNLLNLPVDCEQLGVLGDKDLGALYHRASALLLTSLTNYSIIPIEAMACGTTVVDVDLPSIRSVFTDRKDILLAHPDSLSMARTTLEALDHAELRAAICKGGLDAAARREWPPVLERLEKELVDAFFA